MVKRRVFQPFYEQWAVWLQMKNHNRVCNGDCCHEEKQLVSTNPSLYLISVLCFSSRPLLLAKQNTAMKCLISILNNSDCNHNNYSHIWTFLKVGFGLEFCLRRLALPVFGPDARRSTMKESVLPPLCTIYISPPFDKRHSYYYSIWQKTFILVPNSTQDLHITPPFYTRPYIHNSLKTNSSFLKNYFLTPLRGSD